MVRPLKIISSLAALSIFLFLSCKKEYPANLIPGSFIKTYATDSICYATFVKQMPDGGFLIIASEGAGQPVFIRTDKSGNQKWVKIIPEYCFFLFSNKSSNCWTTEVEPWHFALQAGKYTTILDSSGDIVDAYQLPPSGAGYVYWINGTLLKNGYINYKTSNYIFVFDQNLVFRKTDVFSDSLMGGKTLGFLVYGVTSSGAYNIWGYKFPRNNWSWQDNSKIFIARVHGKAHVIQTIIDSGNQEFTDVPENQVTGPDSSIIMLAQRFDYKNSTTYPLILKFDKNQNLVWEKELTSTSGAINLYYISACSDGGFILTGQVQNYGLTDQYPYAIKIDANGNQQWNKTITTKGNGEFLKGILTDDGGYAFVGYTNAFGKGKTGYRILFIKTDVNGNL